jgi:lysophospholipase L1-like esterase
VKSKKLGLKLAFTVCVVLAVLIGANFAVKPLIKHPVVNAYEGLYLPHPDRMYTLKPRAQLTVPVGMFGPYAQQWEQSGKVYTIKINTLGYRDRAFSRRPGRDVFRIVCIGDSSTFGWDVQAIHTFSETMERLLRRRVRDQTVEILNLGIPGYSSHQGRLLLDEKVWGLKPDALIIAYGRNDELDTAFAPTADGVLRADSEMMPRKDTPPEQNQKSLLHKIRSTSLYRFLLGQAAQFKSRHGEPNPKPDETADPAKRRVSVAKYRENLSAMVTQANNRKVPVALLALGMYLEPYRNAAMEVAKENNVTGFDFSPIFSDSVEKIRVEPIFSECRRSLEIALGKELVDSSEGGWLYYSTDFGHPNSCGHQVIAQTLLPTVIEWIEDSREPAPETPPVDTSSSASSLPVKKTE